MWIQTIISVIIVSLLSVFVAIPFFLKKSISKGILTILLSLSAGTLLGGVFFHFLPEITEHHYETQTAALIIVGIVTFFIIEKLVHHHHQHDKQDGHGHAYHLAPVNLVGDALHNFIDGIVIASSYVISPALGIAATVSVIFHEIPQEIADFGVLLYAGLSKKKAIIFNLLSALTALLGAGLTLIIAQTHEITEYILPFAVGSFIYIAAANLIPELHKNTGIKHTLVQTAALIIGVLLMFALTFLGAEHSH